MTHLPVAGRDGNKTGALHMRHPGDHEGEQSQMRHSKIIPVLAIACCLLPVACFAGEASEVEALRKRVKELEIETLKLRLNLADEKLVTTRFEFNTLVAERGRICNELSATDQQIFRERCTEKKP